MADFLNFHIWAWNLEFQERSQSCMCTLFLPHGVESKLIFDLLAAVFKIRGDFQNFHIWAWNLELEERSQSCIVLSFYPRGSKLSLYSLYWQPISRYGLIFKISIFGHEIWNLKIGPKVAYILFLNRRGSKLSLFLLYEHPFSRYGPICKVSIFGH